MTTIWHNPRCSKSRQTLDLLRNRGIEPDVVRYLDNPPSAEEISDVLEMLGIKPRELMRTKEEAYKLNGLADVDETDALIRAMRENPILIERPVVIHNGKAALGRPPEKVLSVL